MSKMIQVRNVPERLHKELVRRAKRRALTLSDFIKQLLEREASRDDLEDVLSRIESRPPIDLDGETGSSLIRAARRDAGLV